MNPTNPAAQMPPNEKQIDRTRTIPSQYASERTSSLTLIERWENEKFADGPWNILHSFVPVAGWKESVNEKGTVSMKAEDGSAKGDSNL
jgi:hypothetical protein